MLQSSIQRERDRALDSVVSFGRQFHDHITDNIDDVKIVAQPSGEAIRTRVALQCVIACAAQECVIATATRKAVVAIVA